MELRRVDVEIDELFGRLERELSQQYGIDESEDGRVGANSHRQGQNGDQREARALPQPPGRIAKVSPDRGQERIAVPVPALHAVCGHAPPPIVGRRESNARPPQV